MYSYGTVNSIFVEIQPDSTNIKNDPRIFSTKLIKWLDVISQINVDFTMLQRVNASIQTNMVGGSSKASRDGSFEDILAPWPHTFLNLITFQ